MRLKECFIKIIILMTMVWGLSGCTNIDDFLSNKIVQKSGIYEEETYQQYESLVGQYEIGIEGYYYDTDNRETINDKMIRVTFANNSYLRVSYYADMNQESVIDPSECWINPGDSIYAIVESSGNAVGNMYLFSGFRVVEYDDHGKRNLSSLTMREEEGQYILHIPNSFEGKELSIEPLGDYQKRIIKFSSVYKDENELEHDGTGIWMVDDKEYKSSHAEINPVSSYIISYKYDKDEYFYVSSNPESFFVNDFDGVVIFEQKEADDETEDYMVELHKYFSEVLVSDMDRKFRINNGPDQVVNANSEIKFEHLRYGDVITLETDREWSGLEYEPKFVFDKVEKKQVYQSSMYGYKYTLIVPEKDGEFLFDPKEYSYEHGKISFFVCGQKVTTPQMLPKGRKIFYESQQVDIGYWLSGSTSSHYIKVNGEGTKEELQAIHFTPKKNVTVDLPQPKAGGMVLYWLNGERVYSSCCETYSGAIIKMKFNPWEGWICKDDIYKGDAVYKVSDERKQIVNVENKKIEDAFVEDEEHKPQLSVRLEKSVGTAMEFTLEASGYRMDVTSYGGGWKVTDIFNPNAKTYDILNNEQIIVSGQKIGTDKPIQITMGKRAIQSGKAVRTIVTLTDGNNKKKTETRYVDDLSVNYDPIYIYPEGTNVSGK